MLQVVEGINRTFELKDLLRKCMEAAKIVMHSEASSLMLLDESTGELNVSIPTGPVKETISGISIPKNKGISGWVLSNNKSYFSNNVDESEHFWKDLSEDFNTRNIVCVPLESSEGDAFGVIQAINKKENKEFNEDDVFVFETLAFHAASAIERARKYEEVVSKLQEREVQISEIHHRLKNNLATISALIEFDLMDAKDVETQRLLASTSSRVKSVAEGHSLLYDKVDSERIVLSDYLQSIINNVERVFNDPQKDIQINVDLEEIVIDANRAMLCGLIINELLINSYKHAFVGQLKGTISLKLNKSPEDEISILLMDDGVGFTDEEGDDDSNVKPNGQFIVAAMAQKLKADIDYFNQEDGTGTICEISFSL